MAEQQTSFQDRTEPATQKRRDDARKKGNVARSMEINSAAVILGGLLALMMLGGYILQTIITGTCYIYSRASSWQVEVSQLQEIGRYSAEITAKAVLPFMLLVLAIGLAANLAQVGFLASAEAIKPDFDKLNPVKGLKNIFSSRSLNELVKNFVKIMVVGFVAWLIVRSELGGFSRLGDQTTAGMLMAVARSTRRLIIWTAVFLAIIAAFDWWFQKWDHARKLRMTKQEIRDERKQTEGDPLLKSHIRSLQFEMTFRRMLNDVPEADVVITNPTSYAIALKYRADTMRAPRVLAKGARKVAERIREIAAKHEIPVIENPPLTRSMYHIVEVGVEVPVEFYQAIAEVLALVYEGARNRHPLRADTSPYHTSEKQVRAGLLSSTKQ
ncbi:MAG: flagellar biosynthesis protein FlhB [Candidatus Delongbacteria bacterium]|nr:flagellar biosynthesis protein FlhB [Candidatus Delongbacteria bacterium]